MLGTCARILPLMVDVELGGRGESGVAVRVELLDSEDMDGAGETVRDDSPEEVSIGGVFIEDNRSREACACIRRARRDEFK